MRLIIAFLIASLCGVVYAKPNRTNRGKSVAKEAYPRAKRGRKNFSRYRRPVRRRTKPVKPKTAKRKPQKPPAPKRREQKVEAKNTTENKKKSLTPRKRYYNSMMLLWVDDILKQQ